MQFSAWWVQLPVLPGRLWGICLKGKLGRLSKPLIFFDYTFYNPVNHKKYRNRVKLMVQIKNPLFAYLCPDEQRAGILHKKRTGFQ